MTFDRRQQESRQTALEKKEGWDEAWRNNVLGDAAYELSLLGVGFSRDDARHELGKLMIERENKYGKR